MNRSSPVNVSPISACGLPAVIASAARYRPTGQPSVRRTSSRQVLPRRARPRPRRAAPGLRARPWRGRRRRSPRCRPGHGGGPSAAAARRREPMASCDPVGRPSRQLRRPRPGDSGLRDRLEMVEDERDGCAQACDGRHEVSGPATAGGGRRQRAGTRSGRSARSDRPPRRCTSAAPRGRCRGRRATPTPPAAAGARPTAPAASSCRSPAGRRRRSTASRAR